jgi:predicted ATPase
LKKTLANAAMITFEELAEENHCSDDYSALIKKFPNIFITNVPIFTTNNMESCRRFIAFIDIAYDQGAKIFIESHTDPESLYQDPLKRLPFERTQSRLKEML